MPTFDAQLWWCNEISQARESQSSTERADPPNLGLVQFVGQNQSIFLNVKISSDMYIYVYEYVIVCNNM